MPEIKDFGFALDALNAGNKACRAGWNGKGMWLVLVLGHQGLGSEDPGGSRYHAPWIGMKTADNRFVPWLASQTDILADDWEIVD